MPYALQYKPFIDKEVRTSKSKLKPRKIYRITSYQYSDGTQKSLSGTNTTLVFCTGIYQHKLYGIKISEVKPEKFFSWLKNLMIKNLKEADFIDGKLLSNYISLTDRAGHKIFDSYLKGKQIYEKDPAPFRTYSIDGIKQITEIVIKPKKLMAIYGLHPSGDNKAENPTPIKVEPQPTIQSDAPILPITPISK